MNATVPAAHRCRQRVTIGGRVQGVGFRPFIYRLAKTYKLSGSVANARDGVILELEGSAGAIEQFLKALRAEAPAHARIDSLQSENIPTTDDSDFSIIENPSDRNSSHSNLTLPVDLAICDNCRAELFDPNNRRHNHPFIACCDCGPRWSALIALPWNRANTSLANFAMCSACTEEYRDPANRRFHAQNNCCPDCGPHLSLWNRSGDIVCERDDALNKTIDALRDGAIVAVKGLGGFHLMIDARNAEAIARLRERKHRPQKPLAAMFENIAQLERYCECTAAERELLVGKEAPIVLLNARGNLPALLAPNNPRLGAMLAYTPLHLLLLRETGFPIVATSGNRSGEPICADENEVLQKLSDIADYFLVHDRPIPNPIDDSVAQIAADRPMLLRCARGYAPLDIENENANTKNVLALGGQQKNTVALFDGKRIRVSPHIGDLGSAASEIALRRTVEKLQTFSDIRVERFACDLNPDYRSSRLACEYIDHPIHVQHHRAHIAAVMCEHNLDGEVLGIAWDGSGLGHDYTLSAYKLWGGEFFLASRASYVRVAALRDFALPGGESAVREPRRIALSLLHELSDGDLSSLVDLPLLQQFTSSELSMLQTMLDRNVNCPRTSSVGRLFDGVAALLGLQSIASFEGQAAMAVQFAAERHKKNVEPFEFAIDKSIQPYRVDWRPMLEFIIEAIRSRQSVETISARFHATLAIMIASIAKEFDGRKIVLAGGCFQNRLLLENTVEALHKMNRVVFWPQRLPPNDGALALGQIAVAQAISSTDQSTPTTRSCA